MLRRAPEAKNVLVEQRSEPRIAAAGEVLLSMQRPETLNIVGRLLDMSESGFRAEHHCLGLPAGQLLQFRHPHGRGRARVVWNRITGGSVQTGFVVLAYDE